MQVAPADPQLLVSVNRVCNRGEDLAKYEDADEDEEGGGGSEDGDKLDKLDAMVMEAAVVVRVERNVLPKQVRVWGGDEAGWGRMRMLR